MLRPTTAKATFALCARPASRYRSLYSVVAALEREALISPRETVRELMDGWNRGSGDAFAAVFTEDGDLVVCYLFQKPS